MSSSGFRPGQRIGHFDGQLLAARDLQDEADGERRLRGLHVRASHNTWGVALGFEVLWRSPTLIQVGPGVAYDAHGRELVSAQTINVGLPVRPRGSAAGAWWFDLVIRYDDEIGRSDGQLACFSGLRPGEERPTWRWCYAGEVSEQAGQTVAVSPEVRLGEDVPLVRCRVDAEPGFGAELDFGVRRQAQGMVRPHVAGGQLKRTMPWSPALAAFTTSVDTTAAGFNQTPFYFARITIPELFDSPLGAQVLRSLIGPFPSVRAPARSSFQLDVRLATSPFRGVVGFARLAAAATPQLPVEITWAGIEPNGGCTPTLQPLGGLFLYLPLDFFSQSVTLSQTTRL